MRTLVFDRVVINNIATGTSNIAIDIVPTVIITDCVFDKTGALRVGMGSSGGTPPLSWSIDRNVFIKSSTGSNSSTSIELRPT